jgi:hypothetical protein
MRTAIGSMVIPLAYCATTSAHRLNLTPGAAVAPAIFAALNTSHDGRISSDEGRAYANQVLNDVPLRLQGDEHHVGYGSCL